MTRLPSLFVSHGAPTFATEPGRAGPLLRDTAQSLPRPKAVLILSPHWITRDVEVSTAAAPETIHDFGGFPDELYQIQYPAPGSPEVAARAIELLQAAGFKARANPSRGLDHGAWVPVRHMYPDADVPVVQVSMPHTLDGESALAFGRALAPLADEGVLIIGSGSLTHNLYEFRGGATEAAPYAVEFVDWARKAVRGHDANALSHYLESAPHAKRAHPTPDHYLPLPFAYGAAPQGGEVKVLDGGILYGMLAMESYLFGDAQAAAA
ncbi:DODA-type extradiol aromatic ring-opening family dioxygenase [Caenimonas aquaedulcis]|uniref:Dioxygenase n=1 Tax=Caenimonas aquaedulcis TaxID=2793270 RepID=A0A931H7J9_9BURK|nr:class III extradiol ring-cleavage dioxygenase [Caenimonas aquaedulcis]MBG9389843.1 dioxygenase [Caenimonas aquaedulcis]